VFIGIKVHIFFSWRHKNLALFFQTVSNLSIRVGSLASPNAVFLFRYQEKKGFIEIARWQDSIREIDSTVLCRLWERLISFALSTNPDMVTTRSDTNRESRNARNVREEGNSNDPQITLLNERMEQMAKGIEDLANLNAILQARISEHSRVATENR
jgi:hypothetical protein